MAASVSRARYLRNLVRDIHHRVHVEQAIHALAYHRQALKAHACVDILCGQLGVSAVPLIVELGEHIVPDLYIPVALAADGAVRPAAAVFFAPVEINFRARAARSGAMLPEVVRLAEPENALGRYPDFLIPNLKRLVVVQIDRRIELVRINAYPLGAGEKFPAPGNGLAFKIITEREVSQHLKKRAVPCRFPNVFNIPRAYAFLAGAHAAAGRLHLSGKVRLHWRHTGVDEQ